MTETQMQEIEARAQAATAGGRLMIDPEFSCGTPKGYARREPGATVYTQTGWHDVTYGYEIRAGRNVIHAGLITVRPGETPQAPPDALFFEHAREDMFALLAALREARAGK